MSVTYAAAATLPDALAALAGGARPVAGGTDLVVGARQGKAPLPDSLVAIHRLARAARDHRAARAAACASARSPATPTSWRTRPCASATPRSPTARRIVGSHATRHVGTIGGNVMNASPAMETGGPLLCFGAEAVLPRSPASAGSRSRACSRGRAAPAPGRTSCWWPSSCRSPAGGSCYVRLEYRRQMEIAVVGATCSVTLDGDLGRVGAGRDHGARAAHRARARRRGGARRERRRCGGRRRSPPTPPRPRRSPISDVRASADYRRAMAAVIARRAIAAALARARGRATRSPSPPARPCTAPTRRRTPCDTTPS